MTYNSTTNTREKKTGIIQGYKHKRRKKKKKNRYKAGIPTNTKGMDQNSLTPGAMGLIAAFDHCNTDGRVFLRLLEPPTDKPLGLGLRKG